MEKQIIILAAGKGTRMASSIPKPMQQVNNQPMLESVVSAALKVTSDIVLVHSNAMRAYLNSYTQTQLVLQQDQNGTAHAVFCALDKISITAFVTVIYADHPFIDNIVIEKVLAKIMTTSHSVVTLASIQDSANAYGRIMAEGEHVKQIIEFKDLSPEQQHVKLCNSAVMCFAPGVLHEHLPTLLAQPKEGEYYLTSIVELLVSAGKSASYIIDQNHRYSIGVNTKSELEIANQLN
jgi:bifunctional UDP-N-acetylglucosamine pyrophosphorylase/glucosamine-1-phosphate N-acetyltransferase